VSKPSQIEVNQQRKDRRKLRDAEKNHDVVVFRYMKQGEQEYEQRVVEVDHVRVADSSGEMYLHGFDVMRQGARNFQVDRIQSGSVKRAS
jgi:predicted DNA-binding transcriptional regulator YafY